MDYNYEDIKKAYQEAGVSKGRVVLLKTDLRFLGAYDHSDQNEMLAAHFNVLSELIDFNEGTLVVNTSNTSLCNTTIPFDINNTPSRMGVLTEYIRTQPGAVRSFHPFVSWVAIGKKAEYICNDISRHAFGPETPKARMLELNTLYISVGMEPRFTCSVVHHIEMIMGVPHRYVKEFEHPIAYDDGVRNELFYMHVWTRDIGLKPNRNQKIFEHFYQSGYQVKEVPLGRGKIYSYSMDEFYRSTVQFLKKDIYGWLDEPPAKRPYRK